MGESPNQLSNYYVRSLHIVRISERKERPECAQAYNFRRAKCAEKMEEKRKWLVSQVLTYLEKNELRSV